MIDLRQVRDGFDEIVDFLGGVLFFFSLDDVPGTVRVLHAMKRQALPGDDFHPENVGGLQGQKTLALKRAFPFRISSSKTR